MIEQRALKVRHGSSGFTLIEVMFALAIFSLVAVALVGTTTQTLNATLSLRERTQAGIVARNALAELRSVPALNGPGNGTFERQNFGRSWWVDWRAEDPQSETWGAWLLRVTVDVRTQPGGSPLHEITTLMPVAP